VLQAGWSIGRFSSAKWIHEVNVPTVVVVTTHDTVVAPARQARLAQAIPGAEVVKVAGDHGVCVTDPQRFVPALLQAVQRVSAASTSRAAATTAAE
jgi:3-oxoadipate enol-lactonase